MAGLQQIEDLAREADGLSATDDQQKRNEIAGRMNDDIDRLFIRLLDTQQQVIDLAVKNANAARAAQAAAQAAQAATTITNNAAAAPPAEVVTNLGEFMPRIGPLLIDRLAIGEHLFKLKSQGINTSQYVSHFSEMEALARASDIPRLQIKLRELQNHLGLKPISDKERRETTIFK